MCTVVANIGSRLAIYFNYDIFSTAKEQTPILHTIILGIGVQFLNIFVFSKFIPYK